MAVKYLSTITSKRTKLSTPSRKASKSVFTLLPSPQNFPSSTTLSLLTLRKQNNHALRQLPYNGKKTVPAALRKDLWAPLACINFTEAEAADPLSPPQQYGLKTFQKLREYRKLHETQWPKSFALDPKTNRPLTRIERGRRLCDQKANSVADIAAALSAVTLKREVREVEVEVEREVEGGKKVVEKELREMKVLEPLVNATVQWNDILDAEFAAHWPKTVVHDQWVTTFNNRRAPIIGTALKEVEVAEDAVLEPVKNEAGKVEL